MSDKTIEVSCAVLVMDGKVFLAQRSAAKSQGLKWEFPGGKIEPGETAENALKREIYEELGARVKVLNKLDRVSWSQANPGDLVIILHPFVCKLEDGIFKLKEHIASQWVEPENIIGKIDLCEADIPIVSQLLSKRFWRP
jgi:8-oxo-dGTP diphosphatase